MPNFFIDRPVFAWVIPILICIGGVIAMMNMGSIRIRTSRRRR
jgi:multidrug efflux pump